MKKYYLAYGSNLNLEIMNQRCNDSRFIDTTFLKDYRLVYKGISDYKAFLTIEKDLGSFVPVGIYEISNEDESELDYCECVPILYHKHYIFMESLNSNALIYIMNNNYNYHLPTSTYIEDCKQGYIDMNFDLNILDNCLMYTKNQRSKQLIKKLSN